MHENMFDVMDQISDRHLEDAANWKRRRSRIWVRAAAAVLAVVMLLVLFRPEPYAVSAEELVSPAGVSLTQPPREEDYPDWETYWEARTEYRERQDARNAEADQAMTEMTAFWKESFRAFLDGAENGVWSPVNAYLSLAMLAQTASGETRQELLDVLCAESIDSLQEDVRLIWQRVWKDEKTSKRLLANSLWLDESLTYQQENLKVLGERYYASVYRTELEDPAADEDIQAWMNRNTQGFLESLSPAGSTGSGRRVLALASTIFVDENWLETFDPANTFGGQFKSPGGDVSCMYMNAQMDTADYIRGADYAAVALSTEGGCRFWMILPDGDRSVSDLLDSGDYLTAILGQEAESKKVVLKMPKFDIQDSIDLSAGLQKLGVQKAFSLFGGDFSDTLDGFGPVSVSEIRQSARISVDETGIRAVSGTVIDMIAAGVDDPITVVLDRPFLFMLTMGDIPLFAGVVAEP